MLIRKLFNTIFVTIIVSVLFSSDYIYGIHRISENSYQLGKSFLGWTLVYFLYSGAVILVFANLVSLGIEWIAKKIKMNSLIFILLHGFVGAITGLFFQQWLVILVITGIALLYAICDRWQFYREIHGKSIIPLVVIPFAFIILPLIYFTIISEPRPPFLKEDAVAAATEGSGSIIEKFPNEIGIEKGVEKGIPYIRETSVKKIKHEVYLVSFTESWRGGEYLISYEVERNSSTLKEMKGDYPTYWE